MAWTDDRVEKLRKLWTEGLSASQIAKELGGVTRNAVIGKVHRLGLSGRATPSRPPKRQVTRARPRTTIQPARPATAAPVRRPLVADSQPVRPITEPPLAPARLPSGDFATVLNLSEHICKWPIGDPADPEFRFCGRKAKAGSPYCEAHCQVAFQAPKRRKRGESSAKSALDAIAATRRVNSW